MVVVSSHLTTIYDSGGEVEKLIAKHFELQRERESEFGVFHTKELWEYVASEATLVQSLEGDKSVDYIFEVLDRLYRSENQKEFHEAFVITSLRLIYGKRFKDEKYRIMKKYGWNNLKQQCIISCGGKSYAVSMYVPAAALYIYPGDMIKDGENRGEIISIFSPSKRQSTMLITHIYAMIERMGVVDRAVRKTAENIYILNYRGQVAMINAYPFVVKTLKGVNGDILILEEMSQIPDQVLNEVIMPLFQLEQTCLIGISTLLDEDNTMSQLLELKDNDSQKIFNTKEIFMACARCRQMGKASSCNHNTNNLVSWQSLRKHAYIRHMMKANEEVYEQEISGVMQALNERMFKEKLMCIFLIVYLSN